MMTNAVLRFGLMGTAVLFAARGAWCGPVLVTTNFVDHWVTNTIEVRVPVNRVVNEYHTNLMQHVSTNVVDFFATNHVTQLVTNNVLVNRTNFLHAYQTNYKTLHLTNWSTVLVFKTNWVTQGMTNLVELDVPRANAAPARTAAVERPAAADTSTGNDAVVLEARRGSSGGVVNIPVEISARWTSGSTRPLRVEQWKVEGERSAILCFGQESEFRRALPPGRYRVELKARGSNAALTIKGTLVVSSTEVSMERRLAQK